MTAMDFVFRASPRHRKFLALMIFARDYHSGMWSRGYRISCKINKKMQEEFPGFQFLEDSELLALMDKVLYSKLVKTCRGNV